MSEANYITALALIYFFIKSTFLQYENRKLLKLIEDLTYDRPQ